jgi:hypothetical protein
MCLQTCRPICDTYYFRVDHEQPFNFCTLTKCVCTYVIETTKIKLLLNVSAYITLILSCCDLPTGCSVSKSFSLSLSHTHTHTQRKTLVQRGGCVLESGEFDESRTVMGTTVELKIYVAI